MSTKKVYLKDFIGRNKVLFFILMLGVIIQPLCSVLVTNYIKRIVDGISSFDSKFIMNTIIACGFVIGTYFFAWMCKYISSILVFRFAFRIKMDVLKKLKDMKYQMFEKMKIGDINSVISDDIEAAAIIIKLYSDGFIMPILEGFMVVLYMIILDWKMAIFSLIGVFLMNCFSKFFVPIISKKSYEVKQSKGNINQVLVKIFQGIDTIKIFGADGFIQNKFNESRSKIFKARMRIQMAFSNQDICLGSIGFIFTNVAIIFIAYYVIKTKSSMGVMITYMILIEKVMTSSRVAFSQLGRFGSCNAAWKRIDKIIEQEKEEEIEGAVQSNWDENIDSLSIKNLSFKREKSEILNDINMNFERGKIYCIKGESGCGKSTLLKIIVGLYKQGDGKILMDDNMKTSMLYNAAYISAMPKLFNLSIYENIILGNYKLKEEEVYNLSKRLGAHSWISKLDKGYSTKITANGGNISGGQRQQLAIIRGILMKRKILIMDEPFSNLDADIEKKLNVFFEEEKDKMIIVYSSHRESTFKYCDQLLNLG